MSCSPRTHEPSSMYDVRVRSLGRFALAAALLAAAPNAGTTQQGAPQVPPPTFASRVDLVTVDVVVVDKAGRPVRGLTPRDFEVEEDGTPQAIVSFEAVVSEPEAAAPVAGAAAPADASRSARRVGRAFAVVLDDLGLDLSGSVETRRAVGDFLNQSLGEGDEVIVGTTSGAAWWSGRLPEAREDLLAVVARLRSRRANPVETPDWISDYEAYQINKDDLLSGQTVDRVVSRFHLRNVCLERDPGCPGMVKGQARVVDAQRKARSLATLATVRRALDALVSTRGRKSLLLYSPGFPEDSDLRMRDVVAASRQSNTAVYFIDARGLITSAVGADSQGVADVADSGRTAFDERTVASMGASGLASDTGGFSVRNTNDLAGGSEKIALESRNFYMLGIEPAPGKTPGSWRSLRVRVRREGLTVRTRRGYIAAPLPREAKTDPKKDQNARRLPPEVEALVDNAKELDGISLRAMPYVLEPRDKGETRVLVAAEVDLSSLAEQTAGKALQLDLTTAVTLRDTGKTLYSHARIDGKTVDQKGGWRSVAREFELPPGVAQARVVVREQTSGAIGAVTTRFEVPPGTGLRVSTPVLSDQVSKPEHAGANPRALIAAHRRFAPGGELYVEFEVFGAKPEASGGAQVSADLELRSPDGTVVRQTPPTRIAPDSQKRLLRLVGLGALAAGDYELVLNVRDEVAGTSVACREAFEIGD
jgi:VWFA-related protein